MKVSVRSAKEDEKDILYNLLQLYLHDFSEFSPQETDGRGRFTYPYLDHYWQDPQRFPFIIYVERNIAGFALVRTEDDPDTGDVIILYSIIKIWFIIENMERLQLVQL